MKRPARTDPEAAVDAVADELKRLAKQFRKRVRRGIPKRGPGRDDAVHDLRTGTRRLLALLLALRPLEDKKLRRVTRRVRKVLDWTGSLRDIAVEGEQFQQLNPRRAAVSGFVRRL